MLEYFEKRKHQLRIANVKRLSADLNSLRGNFNKRVFCKILRLESFTFIFEYYFHQLTKTPYFEKNYNDDVNNEILTFRDSLAPTRKSTAATDKDSEPKGADHANA